jgi:hypothetical protein
VVARRQRRECAPRAVRIREVRAIVGLLEQRITHAGKIVLDLVLCSTESAEEVWPLVPNEHGGKLGSLVNASNIELSRGDSHDRVSLKTAR